MWYYNCRFFSATSYRPDGRFQYTSDGDDAEPYSEDIGSSGEEDTDEKNECDGHVERCVAKYEATHLDRKYINKRG